MQNILLMLNTVWFSSLEQDLCNPYVSYFSRQGRATLVCRHRRQEGNIGSHSHQQFKHINNLNSYLHLVWLAMILFVQFGVSRYLDCCVIWSLSKSVGFKLHACCHFFPFLSFLWLFGIVLLLCTYLFFKIIWTSLKSGIKLISL